MSDTSSISSAVLLPLAESLGDSWCKTEFKAVKFSYVWIIENFSLCEMESGQFLTSSTFSADPDDDEQPKWKLQLRCDSQIGADYLLLYLYLENATTSPIKATFELAVLDENGEKTNAQSQTHKFIKGQNQSAIAILRSNLTNAQNELLSSDRLSIFCEVSTVVDSIKVTGQNKFTTLGRVPQSRLVTDMGALLETGLHADFALFSENEEFKVHKAVLACRSPVFAAMFSNDTEEKRTNCVLIEDVTAPVLGQLLHLVYTGEAPPLLDEQDMAKALLAAADKYQLDRLKAMCEQQLCASMNSKNVCELMTLADLHSAEHLKTRAIAYIGSNADEVIESEAWDEVVATRPVLLNQVFKALHSQKKRQES